MTAPAQPKVPRRLTFVEYTKLRGAGYTDDEIKADNLLPPVERPAQDATNAPFLTGADASAAHQQSQAGMRGDVAGMAMSGMQGASFGLADDVVPGLGQAVQSFEERKPGLAQMGEIAGSLAVPGTAAVKAVKAIAPMTMAAQVATGAGIGSADAFLSTFGNAEGSLAERFSAALKAVPQAAGVGALVGAVPGMVVKGKTIAVAAGRTAMRASQGRLPRPTDVMTMLRATPPDDLAELLARAKTPSPQVDANDLLGLRRLSVSPGPGTSYAPVKQPISAEALARKQRGPSAAAIDKRNLHAKELLSKAKTKITPAQYDAITSNPENLEALLQLTVKRLKQTGQAGSIVGQIPPLP